MKLIERKDIEDWARRIGSKAFLPTLVSRLVHFSTPKDTFSEFPDGTSTYVGGWDGKVRCSENTSFVPGGNSGWEFGTEESNNKKANEDYEKRKADPLGYDPASTVFLFLTPTFWRDKDKWQNEKIKEGFWKDVKAYDSRNLEDWIGRSPAVSLWFAALIKKYPNDGIHLPEEFWKDWSIGPRGTLLPAVVTAGRQHESKQLMNFLVGEPNIKAIKGSSKDEVIAFIIASAMEADQGEQSRFFPRSLIVDTANNFRSICINQNSLVLISRIEENKILYRGVSEGHHVLVPLGADDTFNATDIINLPGVDRDGQVDALIAMGLSREEAIRFSRDAGRNVSVLKRLLGFPDDKLEWSTSDAANDLLPAMLVGRWDESYRGDRVIIEKLSGLSYDKYSAGASRWRDVSAAPVLQIGSKWRLTSPLDAWINLSKHLTKPYLDGLRECFLLVMREKDKSLELDVSKRMYAALHIERPEHSDWVREGLTQSLILVGLYGEGLKIQTGTFDQGWVDETVAELLTNMDGAGWASLNREMPLIAEASPEVFLQATSLSLSAANSPIMEMFVEEQSLLHSTSRHTGLLWALEGLAWLPEFFHRAVIMLGRLAEVEPGGNLTNRPINSLTEIFKPWHVQTLAKFNDRLDALKQIAEVAPSTGWTLMIRMLPSPHPIAFPTHKMRWRMLNESAGSRITNGEIWDTHDAIIELMLARPNLKSAQIAELVERTVQLRNSPRDKVLSFLEANADSFPKNDLVIWNQLRQILSHHRSFPQADWSLPETILTRYEHLYNLFTPQDVILRNIWLFQDHWPGLIEGIERRQLTFEQQDEYIQQKRLDALREIYTSFGLEKLIELAGEVKESFIYGFALAQLLDSESEIEKVFALLDHDDARLRVAQSFVSKKGWRNQQWIERSLVKLQNSGASDEVITRFLTPLEQTRNLWDLVDTLPERIPERYWQSLEPRFWHVSVEDRIYGIERLLYYGRFISAIDACYFQIEGLPTEIILLVLESLMAGKPSENRTIQNHEVETLLSTLDSREGIDEGRMVGIEWFYLPLLSRYGSTRTPKLLHERLAKSPEFFNEVLKLIYKSDNDKNPESEVDENRQQRALVAYELLHSWKKLPGLRSDGNIEEAELKVWVTQARELATASGRLEVADMHIGQVLAQYKEDVSIWPPREISSLIDSINTDSLKDNFSAATSNKRGSSTRGAFDGGDIERQHAAFFKEMADKNQDFPVTAAILRNLSRRYLEDAKQMDNRAEIDKLDY